MSDLLMLAFLTATRERKGTKHCREMVGRMRELIAVPITGNVVGLSAYAEAQRDSATVLAAHCKVCRRCKLGIE